MMIAADTGFWIALLINNDIFHEAAKSVLLGLKGVDNLILVTTIPVVTETLHLLRKEDQKGLKEKKKGDSRRKLVSAFVETFKKYKVQILSLPNNQHGFSEETCLDGYDACVSQRNSRLFDFADFHLFQVVSLYDCDAVVSSDEKDMPKLREILQLQTVLLLLPKPSLKAETRADS
jgi:predicted nucleic acid-binding protein